MLQIDIQCVHVYKHINMIGLFYGLQAIVMYIIAICKRIHTSEISICESEKIEICAKIKYVIANFYDFSFTICGCTRGDNDLYSHILI